MPIAADVDALAEPDTSDHTRRPTRATRRTRTNGLRNLPRWLADLQKCNSTHARHLEATEAGRSRPTHPPRRLAPARATSILAATRARTHTRAGSPQQPTHTRPRVEECGYYSPARGRQQARQELTRVRLSSGRTQLLKVGRRARGREMDHLAKRQDGRKAQPPTEHLTHCRSRQGARPETRYLTGKIK